jgi:hypothetical protein
MHWWGGTRASEPGRHTETSFPAFGVCLLVNLLASLGVPVRDVLHGPVVIGAWTRSSPGFLLTGVGWLAAEVQGGFRDPR